MFGFIVFGLIIALCIGFLSGGFLGYWAGRYRWVPKSPGEKVPMDRRLLDFESYPIEPKIKQKILHSFLDRASISYNDYTLNTVEYTSRGVFFNEYARLIYELGYIYDQIVVFRNEEYIAKFHSFLPKVMAVYRLIEAWEYNYHKYSGATGLYKSQPSPAQIFDSPVVPPFHQEVMRTLLMDLARHPKGPSDPN